MKIGDKLCNSIALYRSPSQSRDEFEIFAKNYELNLDKILANNHFLTVFLVDCNVRSNLWYTSYKRTNGVSKDGGIASQFGWHQLINEPTHLISKTYSCIDMTNLVMESGVHSALRKNCHHQIMYAKFNLKNYYPPPIWKGSLTLSKAQHWKYQKSNRWVSVGKTFCKYWW